MTEAPDPPAWESVQEELAARGTIVIRGHLDLGLATQAAARLMEHDAVSDRAARVRLYTSSGADSGGKGPPIPGQRDRSFRLKETTDSG